MTHVAVQKRSDLDSVPIQMGTEHLCNLQDAPPNVWSHP